MGFGKSCITSQPCVCWDLLHQKPGRRAPRSRPSSPRNCETSSLFLRPPLPWSRLQLSEPIGARQSPPCVRVTVLPDTSSHLPHGPPSPEPSSVKHPVQILPCGERGAVPTRDRRGVLWSQAGTGTWQLPPEAGTPPPHLGRPDTPLRASPLVSVTQLNSCT